MQADQFIEAGYPWSHPILEIKIQFGHMKHDVEMLTDQLMLKGLLPVTSNL